MLNDFHSIAQENHCQLLDSPETDLAQNISHHPGIERQSNRYWMDESYSKTQLVYSRLTKRIQPSISSRRNEVHAHLKGTILSSLMISDLTLHDYSIQLPILTSCHTLLTYNATPRQASEQFILLHSKHIFFLPECCESLPGSTHRVSSFRYRTWRCRRGSYHSACAEI